MERGSPNPHDGYSCELAGSETRAPGVAAGVGIAPTLSVFQTDVQTDYTIQRVRILGFRFQEPEERPFEKNLKS